MRRNDGDTQSNRPRHASRIVVIAENGDGHMAAPRTAFYEPANVGACDVPPPLFRDLSTQLLADGRSESKIQVPIRPRRDAVTRSLGAIPNMLTHLVDFLVRQVHDGACWRQFMILIGANINPQPIRRNAHQPIGISPGLQHVSDKPPRHQARDTGPRQFDPPRQRSRAIAGRRERQ